MAIDYWFADSEESSDKHCVTHNTVANSSTKRRMTKISLNMIRKNFLSVQTACLWVVVHKADQYDPSQRTQLIFCAAIVCVVNFVVVFVASENKSCSTLMIC